jgi:hypothetical protein
VALADPPVRRIVAARLAASYRSAATASMLGVLQTTAQAFRDEQAGSAFRPARLTVGAAKPPAPIRRAGAGG